MFATVLILTWRLKKEGTAEQWDIDFEIRI